MVVSLDGPGNLRVQRTGGEIDGEAAGEGTATTGFVTLISWSGLDIGLDRGSPVADYPAPFQFSGLLRKVTVVMDEDQALDGEGLAAAV